MGALCPKSSRPFLQSFLLLCLILFLSRISALFPVSALHISLRPRHIAFLAFARLLSLSRRYPFCSVNMTRKDIAMPKGVNKSVVSVTYFFILDYILDAPCICGSNTEHVVCLFRSQTGAPLWASDALQTSLPDLAFLNLSRSARASCWHVGKRWVVRSRKRHGCK